MVQFSLDYLRTTLGVKCNFLEYESIKRKTFMLDTALNEHDYIHPALPAMLEKIGTGEKGCRKIYKILQQKSEKVLDQTAVKWGNLLSEEIIRKEVVKGFQIIHRTPKCVFNKYVQFKFLHNRLNTRKLLCKMEILDSDICLYCGNVVDSETHALIDCPQTAQL